MEINMLRCCKQKDRQSLNEFVTEQPKLSKNCEINDVNVDKEILSQLTQNCNGDVRYTSSVHGKRVVHQ